MTTLSARAHDAWIAVEAESEFGFEGDDDAFEEGFETGFRAAAADMLQRLRALRADAITFERQNAYDRAIEAVEALS